MLFIPLLMIRSGPSASASPEAAVSAAHASTGPVQRHPAGLEQSSRRAGRQPASLRAGPAATATVAYDTTVSATVPGSTQAHDSDGAGRTPSPAAVQVAVTKGSPVAQAAVDPPSSPVTTTTLVPLPQTGAGVTTHGIVTYYAHPAGRCASPWIPFGTTVWITNPANGKSVSCVVDDYETDTARSVDLATATFAEIAPLSQGVIDAELSW